MTASHVGRTVAEVERDLILDTLKHCLGNRTHAANILGISIRTLRNKLNEYMAEGYAVPSPDFGHRLVGGLTSLRAARSDPKGERQGSGLGSSRAFRIFATTMSPRSMIGAETPEKQREKPPRTPVR